MLHFSNSTSLGGAITDTVLDKEYQIVRVINANSYEITSGGSQPTLPTLAMVALTLLELTR